MMLVPTNTLNVVPRINQVTLVAFVYLRIGLFRHSFRDHLKMFHEMAGRRLVTFSATGRARRWVKKPSDGPFGCSVTLRTILAEQLKVGILVRMAARAIKRSLFVTDLRSRTF